MTENKSLADGLLDTLLPGDAVFPSAAATGLALRLAGHARFGAALGPVLGRLPPGFRAGDEAAVALVEAAAPAEFARLLTGVYSLYYTHPLVMAAMAASGIAAGQPPQPLGHHLPPFDPALVAIPAARAPLWRDPQVSP